MTRRNAVDDTVRIEMTMCAGAPDSYGPEMAYGSDTYIAPTNEGIVCSRVHRKMYATCMSVYRHPIDVNHAENCSAPC